MPQSPYPKPEPPLSQIEVNGVFRPVTQIRDGEYVVHIPKQEQLKNCNNCGAPRTSSLCAYCGTGKQKPFITKPSIEIQMAFDRAARSQTNIGLLHDHAILIAAGVALIAGAIIIFCS